MKIQIYCSLLCMALICGIYARDSVETEKEREDEQVRLWEERLQAATGMTPPERVEHLWNGLRSMAGRMTNPYRSPSVDDLYYKIQKTLLATPGHARYLANKIEASRSDGMISRDAYWYLNETLVYLPSPESVAVLGHYLNDVRDKPSPKHFGGTCGTRYEGTFELAFEALPRIGLRDLPVTDMRVDEKKPTPGEKWSDEQRLEAEKKNITARYFRHLEAIESYRTWWEEVQTGKRAFSFKGQAVEYRFKPDGTWDTIPIANPPDDGPMPIPATTIDHPAEKPKGDPEKPVESHFVHSWWWVGIGGALLVFGTWFMRKKRAG